MASNHHHPLKSGVNLLLLLDGYDELSVDMDVNAINHQALWTQLGLSSWSDEWQSRVKLVITCRRQTVPQDQLHTRFAAVSNTDLSTNSTANSSSFNSLVVRYLLPFQVQQMLDFMQHQLGWEDSIRLKYQHMLAEADSLRATLRNPFVLNMLVQSWPVVEPLFGISDHQQQSQHAGWKQLTCDGIYRSFVQHWLNT